jgi:hypothetical protein
MTISVGVGDEEEKKYSVVKDRTAAPFNRFRCKGLSHLFNQVSEIKYTQLNYTRFALCVFFIS